MHYRRLFLAGLIALAGASEILCPLGHGAYANDSTSEMFDIFGHVANADKSKDTAMCETVFYSGLCDQWVKAYIGGKSGEAERIWSNILTKIKDSPSCYILVKKLFQRLESDAPESVSNSSKYGILPYSHFLLAATEKALGRQHRFVADILAFMSTHYDSIKDFKTALILRRREMEIEEKCGPESEMTGFAMLDVAFDLGQLGRYDEARKLTLRVLKFAKARKYERVLPLALKLESELTAAMQRKALRERAGSK